MSLNGDLTDFAARLCRFIAGVSADTSQFDQLALELFALQFRHNAPYRRLCEARGFTPEAVKHWTGIPAAPTVAFKELEFSCLPAAEQTAVFHSSGTTEQRPSRHFHSAESLAVYEASLWEWFASHAPASADAGFVVLTPPPAEAPHSSLVHMFEVIRRKMGLPESVFMGKAAGEGGWTVEWEAVITALRNLESGEQAAGILGTAFSFVQLLDYLSGRGLSFQLPPGSWVLETGGYKGRSRVLAKSELHALITQRLGIPAHRIVCEYGMSELSSQAYDLAVGAAVGTEKPDRVFRFPPWARAQIVSPESGAEVKDDETGLVRVFDLANVFSVMAVQTEDLAIRRGEGFELVGRAPAAEQRGCSLMTADPG